LQGSGIFCRFSEDARRVTSRLSGYFGENQPDWPHPLAAKMRGEVYVGIAGIDPHFTAEEKQRLETALASAGVKNTVGMYPDVKHGLAVTHTPAHDKEASERHGERIAELLGENLPVR
jgi:carboxymethylenebutenolidase